MMLKTKKFIAMLLCIVMTAVFVPALAVGAEAATVYAPDSIAEDETLAIADEVTDDNIRIVIFDSEGNIVFEVIITADEFQNGYAVDTSALPIGSYTLVVYDDENEFVLSEHTFTITSEQTEYNPILSGLDSMTVTRNKTKLYTGTGQDIPDGATVTFTATIADETYAAIDSIVCDDTNHVYVTVKGVRKGTTTMTINMVVDDGDIVYTAVKEVTITIKTSSSGEESGVYYTINSVSNDGAVSVTNDKSYEVGGVLIVAKYADEILIDKEVTEITDMSDGEMTFQSSLTAGEGESLKAFIWQSVDSMRALSNVEEYEE